MKSVHLSQNSRLNSINRIYSSSNINWLNSIINQLMPSQIVEWPRTTDNFHLQKWRTGADYGLEGPLATFLNGPRQTPVFTPAAFLSSCLSKPLAQLRGRQC